MLPNNLVTDLTGRSIVSILQPIDVFLRVAWSLLHTPYIWSGDDPTGFDCSGLVVECLKAVGLAEPKDDYTAHGLWEKFSGECQSEKPSSGALVFWFTGRRATHVAICIDDTHCLTADGGGRHIKCYDDAVRYNAFVKVRPIDHRQGTPFFCDIFSTC